MSGAVLKPCPFCGGTELYWPHGTDPAIIECGGNGCGARSGVPEEQQESEAVALWNRRTPDPAQIRADALREAIWAAFIAGVGQGSDEATAYEWGAAPQQSRQQAFDDFMADWNEDSAYLRALLATPLSPAAVDNSPANETV